MNYALPVALSPFTERRHSLERSLLTRIAALKNRLDNFTVVDAQGELLGEVRNLVLYKRRLHLVIVQPDVHQSWRFMLLSSPLVQRISQRNRTILVHVTHTDVSYLPQQRSLKQTNIGHEASVMAPVSQLPASPADNAIKTPLVVESPETPKVLADIVDTSVERSSSLHQESNAMYHSHSYPATTQPQRVTVGVSDTLR